ncbi:MAG: hypothetical protein V1661_00340 [bacterium]
MFAKIIPFTKLPRKFEHFDYSIPDNFASQIKTGHIVAIYFHGQKIYGLVEKLESHSGINTEKIKPILSITDVVIPQYLIDLVSWMSRYYLASPSLLYKLIIPKETKSRGNLFQYPQKNLTLNKSEAENIVSALKNFSAEKNSFFLYDNNPKETLAAFIKLAEKELQNKKQVLILAPGIQDIENVAPYFNSIFKDRLIISTGRLAAGERYSAWQKLAKNEPAVILGTRPACFFPLQNLSLVCFLNSSSQDYKQWDMNPRYDARTVALKLQELLRTKIVFSDIVPDLNIFNELNAGKISPLNEPPSQLPFSLVDLKQEKNSASPLFSYPLYEMIKAGKGQKTILFLNRQENDSLLICNDCRYTFLCPDCARPFLVGPVRSSTEKTHNKNGTLLLENRASDGVDNGFFLCYHCKVKKPVDTACPKCRGTRLKPINAGINTIKKIIGKEFPDAKIEIVGKGKKAFDKNFDILIATDYFWKNILPGLSGEKIYGAAVLDFDFYFNRPEFNQSETALAALYRIFGFARNFSVQKIIVQTGCPENAIWNDWRDFYKKELKEREALNYPPFAKLVKIICKNPDQAALDYEAKKIYNELVRYGFSATPPFYPYVKKRTKNYIRHIILKIKSEENLDILKDIIPDEYQIDIDPISIY